MLNKKTKKKIKLPKKRKKKLHFLRKPIFKSKKEKSKAKREIKNLKKEKGFFSKNNP